MRSLGRDKSGTTRRSAAASVWAEALADLPPSVHPKTRASSPPPALPLVAAYAPASHPDCRGHLRIGYLITGEQLQGQVEVAYQTDRTQVTTTILWAGRIDAFSRRVLAEALRAAADEGRPVRLNVFAAAACKLFQHTLQTLALRAGYATWAGLSDGLMAEAGTGAGPWRDELLAAIDELSEAAHARPRAIVTERAEADRFVREALSALQGIFASVGRYLEQVLQALDTPMGHSVANAFILEARRELDELAACRMVDEVYVEDLIITGRGDKSVSIEVEGSLGITV